MSVYAGPEISQSGLVLCLDAGSPKSYPGSGNTWVNLANTNLNSTLINGPTYSTNNGGVMIFDGVDDYVETNYIPQSNVSYTISFWGKSSASGYPNRPLGNSDALAGANGASFIWGFRSNPNNLLAARRYGLNNSDRDIEVIISDLSTKIHYISHTYDSSTGSKLYVDGVEVGNNNVLGFTSGMTFRIGKEGNGTDRFNGNIYNVQIYNRALSASEVRQNFNALRGRFGL